MSSLNRILYVEDDPFLRELVLIGLGVEPDLEVCPCETGEEALERAPGFAPQLVLLDVLLPDLDGVELLDRLRRSPGLEDIPAVFLTGHSQPEEIARLEAVAGATYIRKPFEPFTLAARLREVWGG